MFELKKCVRAVLLSECMNYFYAYRGQTTPMSLISQRCHNGYLGIQVFLVQNSAFFFIAFDKLFGRLFLFFDQWNMH
jgi:hypothetical protein